MGNRPEIVVAGGGIAGVCAAAELARRGFAVTLLERHSRLFEETSTHNSGVIHAGLYYPPGSLKARTCVPGNRLTREFCERAGVPHRICGKLVVAHDETETAALENLLRNARSAGAPDVTRVPPEFVREREPSIRTPVAALWSPATGVLDVAEYLNARERDARRAGAEILTGAAVTGIRRDGSRLRIETTRGDTPADILVNAAGLWTDDLEKLAGLPSKTVHPCRGEYYVVTGRKAALVNGLVYPVPHADTAGLGVHLTRTAGGELLIGPNVNWTGSRTDYESGREPPDRFLESARELLPALEMTDLREGYSGIRPKLSPPGAPAADFEIGVEPAGGAFVVSLRGIESPGLTAAPALALETAVRIERLSQP